MMRPPVSLSRLRFTPGWHEVVYARKGGHDEPELTEDERIDAMDFVARVLVQIPDPRRHSVRYYGFYSNAARGKRKKAAATAEPSPVEAPEGAATPQGADRAALRRGWAEMIRRVYEVDPPYAVGRDSASLLSTRGACSRALRDGLPGQEPIEQAAAKETVKRSDPRGSLAHEGQPRPHRSPRLT
jgi:Putative transposase